MTTKINLATQATGIVPSSSTPPPAPFVTGATPTLTMFPNLQTLGSGGWTVDGSTTGGSGIGTASVTFNNTFPTLTTGGSIALTSAGAGYNTQLYTQHNNVSLPSSNPLLITDVTVDLWIWIPSLTDSPQAIEGPDVPMYNGTNIMYPSIQADSASGVWRLWDGSAWQPTSFSCASFLATKDKWQSVHVHYQFNALASQFTYQDLIVNSVPVFQHRGTTYTGGSDSGAVSIKTQIQIDNIAGATSTTIYYDAITTRMWTAGGISATITTAKLTTGGAPGSQTFVNGLLTAQVQAS